MLNFGSQDGFYILFSIIAYLLEFINGYDTRFVCLLQISKDFIQYGFRRMNISQTDIKSRFACNGI